MSALLPTAIKKASDSLRIGLRVSALQPSH
jgi:hypothetical protein